MKVLSCVPCQYYDNPGVGTYEYISFVEVLRRMGHEVHAIDHIVQAQLDEDGFNRFFLSIVKHGKYDLVIIVPYQVEFSPEVLDEAKKYAVSMAWNCDDDWRWDDYSCNWIEHYTYMVTTYRHVSEANKERFPNLLLSQWGCTGLCDGMDVPKDIDISFVGKAYGKRIQQVEELRERFDFVAHGRGIPPSSDFKRRVKKRLARALRIPLNGGESVLLDQDAVKAIWNRSKISFTPLDASRNGSLQIKGRAFDMGLSGTVMLCDKNPALYEFYEPEREFVEFENMEECMEKAKYLLKNDSERESIAVAYYNRTKKEHMFECRCGKI